MSTVPTAPGTPRFSRTSVALLIGGVVIALIAGGIWLWRSPGSSATPPSPPAEVSPARPSGVPYYTKDEMEVLREAARQEERQRLRLEAQYGSK